MTKLEAGKRTTIVSVIANGTLSIIKTTVGFMSGSTALIADGIHSIADLVSDVFAYIMLKVSHGAPDETHPYGHGKFETFGTLILSVSLLLTGVWIAYEAITKYIEQETTLTLGELGLAAALLSILTNEGLYRYCKKLGKLVKSPIIIANAWHHRTDSLSSIAALIGIAFTMAGFPIADSIAALIVTALLIKMSYKIGRQSFDELVDAAIEEDTQEALLIAVKDIPGVVGCHELRARKLGGRIFVDVHVDVPARISVSEGHALAESVEKTLLKAVEEVDDVVTHIDPVGIDQSPLPDELQRPDVEHKIEQIIQKTDPSAQLYELIFHLMEDGYKAHICLKEASLTAEKSKQIQKDVKASTPFTDIGISILA